MLNNIENYNVRFVRRPQHLKSNGYNAIRRAHLSMSRRILFFGKGGGTKPPRVRSKHSVHSQPVLAFRREDVEQEQCTGNPNN